MMRTALTLSWEILSRQRWFYRIFALYLLTICVIVMLLPLTWRSANVAYSLTLPVVAGLVIVMAGCSHGFESDLLARKSCYPQRLFVLPIPHVLLSAVPLLLGAMTILVIWLILVFGVFHPNGVRVLVVLPALTALSCLAWVQALSWLPFPLPWLRFIALTMLMAFLGFGTLVLVKEHVDPTLISWGHAALLITAMSVAFVGVRLGRRGVGCGEPVHEQTRFAQSTPPIVPFSSPLRAQLWLEWRRWIFIHLILVLVTMGGVLVLVDQVDKLLREMPFLIPGFATLEKALGPAWVALTPLLVVPFLWAALGGLEMARLQSLCSRSIRSPFLLTRPISTLDIIRTKLIATALFMAGVWVLLIVFAVGWALIRGHAREMMARLSEATGSTTTVMGLLLGAVLTAYLLSWLWVVGSLGLGLVDDTVSPLIPLVCGGICTGGGFLCLGPNASTGLPVLTGGLIVLVALKGVAVMLVSRLLLRRAIITPMRLCWLLIGWASLVGLLMIGCIWFLSGGLLTALLIVLAVPIARCLVTPVALAWNRHR
jgi:hypothetical protein